MEELREEEIGTHNRQNCSHDQNKSPSFFLPSISSTAGWNRKRKENHSFSVYQPSEPFLFRLGVNNFCKPSWLMKEAPSQACFSGTFQHSVPPAHLWLAGVEKIYEQISELVQFCGGCLLEVETHPVPSLGATLWHPWLQEQVEINILVHGQTVQSRLCVGACKGRRAIQRLPEPENKLALMRLMDMIQFLAKSMPNLPEVHHWENGLKIGWVTWGATLVEWL